MIIRRRARRTTTARTGRVDHGWPRCVVSAVGCLAHRRDPARSGSFPCRVREGSAPHEIRSFGHGVPQVRPPQPFPRPRAPFLRTARDPPFLPGTLRMDEAIPFIPPKSRVPGPDDPPLTPAQVAARAAAMADDVDRRLARRQRAPNLGPIRRPVPERPTAGSVPLPFYSPLNDPARITGAPNRDQRDFPPRVVACVACDYRKLDTRVGDEEEDLSWVPKEVPRSLLLKHLGPGEREYTVCHCCHDVNGTVPRGYYSRWAQSTPRESAQRTYRINDPGLSDERKQAWADLLDRVSGVESWRASRGDVVVGAQVDLGGVLADDPIREREADSDGVYDGLEQEERVTTISDFKGQIAGSGRFGTPDTEFAIGAPYDADVVRSAEAEAWLDDTAWEAARKDSFRAAWQRTGDIGNPGLRHEAQARLVQRWDPRMTLVADDGTGQPTMAMTNPFAEVQLRKNPFSRTAAHSGVDEGFSGEPAWKRAALARHEDAVAAFLQEVRVKLAQRGISEDRIANITALPDLNPGREIGKTGPILPFRDRAEPVPQMVVDRNLLPSDRKPTLGERIAALRPAARPAFLAPAGKLDEIATAASERAQRATDVAPVPPRTGSADEFRHLAERVKERDAFQEQVRAADSDREHVQGVAGALHRADVEMRGATLSFAREIRGAFVDPHAFQAAFKQLGDDEKRAALTILRDRPGEFSREFGTRFGRDFGNAGQMVTSGNPAADPEAARIGRRSFLVTPPSDVERAGVLTASAGERYLDAVAAREVTRKHAARSLGLPDESPLKAVRGTCESRLAAAGDAKRTAIRQRDSVRAPSPAELERAFAGLNPTERGRMMKEVPGLAKMLPDPRREVSRSAPSL